MSISARKSMNHDGDHVQAHEAPVVPLGVIKEYDLPLKNSEDSRFLMLLIGLLSFLAILALAGTFALGEMTSRWSSGLENKITIEVPSETQNGHVLSHETVAKETQKLSKDLKQNANIKSLEVMDEDGMRDLISPWLGTEVDLGDIPLPGLISVELKITSPESLKSLEAEIKSISPYAHVETHQEWLSDLISFTRILKMLSLCIAFIIIGTTVTAMIAGIKTRMAIHRKEVELLHFIGATDEYIARQLQRHSMLIALKGSVFGTVAGIVFTLILILLSTETGTSLIPQIRISLLAFMLLATLPIFVCIIAAFTSHFTAMRTLSKMT